MGIVVAGFIIGLMGSLHCIGMCGPIALALPLPRTNNAAKIAGVLTYNTGRMITYSVFGFVFGWLGKGFILSGYQQVLSISLGVIILLMAILPTRYFQSLSFTRFIIPAISKMKLMLGNLFNRKSYASLFSIGILNGLLPCGLVYTAIAGAIATTDPIKGAAFMALFGLGTVPAMMAVGLTGHIIKTEWKQRFRKFSVGFVVLMGLIFIVRGMDLGIPYVSPELSKTDCTRHTCCHKK